MRINATLAVLTAIALAIHAPIAGLHLWAAVGFTACLAIALALRLQGALHVSLLTTLAVAITAIPVLGPSLSQIPVLPLLIPLLISSLVVAASPATRPTLKWLQYGDISRAMWILVGLTGIGSAVALLAWAAWTDNLGIGAQMMASIAHLPIVVLALLVIPIFAFFNAITEEAVFRGVLYTALTNSSRSITFSNIVQAAAFAAFHFEMGFPNGWLGYAMVFIYGMFLGYLRARTRGLLAPVVAHIVADLVIGYIVLFAPGTT